MWQTGDERWAEETGIDLRALETQLRRLGADDETLAIDRPATIDDGITWLNADTLANLSLPAERIQTFVPASGAATRMFASIVKAHAAGFTTLDELDRALADGRTELQAARDAFTGRDLLGIATGIEHHDLGQVLQQWVEHDQWPTRPKGLVPLHRYAGGARTAVCEHLLEAAALVGTPSPKVHFTVQSGSEDAFLAEADVAKQVGGCAASVSCSVQSPTTDTIAVGPDGELFRDADGRPLLRPGGHGSLLANLEALGGDLVVVKNIDNVTRDENRAQVVAWRRGLVDRLIHVEAQVHGLLAGLQAGHEPAAAIDFAVRTFGRRGAGSTADAMAHDALNRPIRVVAVVRNDGQPGGGPFWVREPDGTCTPQIMESAQINRADPTQSALFESATHFNPVDMALAVRDRHGQAFPLTDFIDERGWLRANKTYQGRPLRALERPGLWNGAMAGWNTLFVEVPSWTFRPVKEVRDLLGDGHRQPA